MEADQPLLSTVLGFRRGPNYMLRFYDNCRICHVDFLRTHRGGERERETIKNSQHVYEYDT